MRKILPIVLSAALVSSALAGCGTAPQAPQSTAQTQSTETQGALADGIYSAVFTTDSGMFHVNESKDGRGELTVKDGKMTLHVSLVSKRIVNLFVGKAEDAKKDGAALLQPTTDKVTYSDGYEEEVYGFDIPVEALDEEFDLALIGTEGKWYDHRVRVSDPQPLENGVDAQGAATVEISKLSDGAYTAEVTLEGGSGRAHIDSPAQLTVRDGKMTASIAWDSEYYDYMMVDGERYEPVNTEGNSVFEIPVTAFGEPIAVSADTTKMSQPHLIDYTLTFDASTLAE